MTVGDVWDKIAPLLFNTPTEGGYVYNAIGDRIQLKEWEASFLWFEVQCNKCVFKDKPHHCRVCGLLVCEFCLKFEVRVFANNSFVGYQKCCEDCAKTVRDHDKRKRAKD